MRPLPPSERSVVSWESWWFLRCEVERLTRELHAVTADRDHWYMRANYTPEEIAEFQHRLTMGLDPETGEWLKFSEQDAR